MNIKNNYSLKNYNSFGVEAYSRYFSYIGSNDEIKALLEWHNQSELPLLLLGGGSNVLFKQDYQGMTAVIATKGIEVIDEDQYYTYVKVAAGENWHQLVRWSVNNGYGGIENLSLIPGTVGAAPIQNIGAYGVELADCFHELEAIDIASGTVSLFDQKACQFGYRDSYFKSSAFGDFLIQSVTLKFAKQPHWIMDYAGVKACLSGQSITSKRISDCIIQLRQSKLPDPLAIGNAGSFFKNPILSSNEWHQLKRQHPKVSAYPQAGGAIKVSAAWLIDHCGWKGKRFGDAGVYEKHALVLVNHGKATGESLWTLATQIIESVEGQFSITLEAEPRLIG